jgi:predicted Zn-dependent protease
MRLIRASPAGHKPIAVDFLPGAVDRALGHLNEALKLSPQDLAIHQKRLQLLEISSRFAEMAQALDESCRIYPEPKAIDTWISYVAELVEARQPQAALSLLTVLDRHFPKDPRVLKETETVLHLLQASPKR